MHLISIIIPYILAFTIACDQNESDEQWISLFNGNDLSGWTVKVAGYQPGNNYNDAFRAEDGMIVADYTQYDNWNSEFAHLFYDTPFSHYRLRLEYRLYGAQMKGAPVWAGFNSGVMLHAQSPESMEVDQEFPISIEMQFLASPPGENRSTGNLASPGTHVMVADTLYEEHMFYSSSKSYKPGEWVQVEAVVLGDSVVHYIVEKDTVLTFSAPQIGGWEKEQETWVADKSWVTNNEGMPLSTGHIALQAESHPVQFRNIRLLDLSSRYK